MRRRSTSPPSTLYAFFTQNINPASKSRRVTPSIQAHVVFFVTCSTCPAPVNTKPRLADTADTTRPRRRRRPTKNFSAARRAALVAQLTSVENHQASTFNRTASPGDSHSFQQTTSIYYTPVCCRASERDTATVSSASSSRHLFIFDAAPAPSETSLPPIAKHARFLRSAPPEPQCSHASTRNQHARSHALDGAHHTSLHLLRIHSGDLWHRRTHLR